MTTGSFMDEETGASDLQEGVNDASAKIISAPAFGQLEPGQGMPTSPVAPVCPSMPELSVPFGDRQAVLAQRLADLVHEALVTEATLTPKPGLVDARNNGSHKDMTLATFLDSADALRPLMPAFVKAGMETAGEPAPVALQPLRSHGLICEEVMNEATGGINTHKGGIFAFGLLLGAAGRFLGRGEGLSVSGLCGEAAQMARGLVKCELANRVKTANTAGEYIYRRYGLTGARGEAESGFELVRLYALPAYLASREAGHDTEAALFAALLELLIRNRDTNLVARGGMEGLFFVREKAQQLKRLGGVFAPDFHARLMAMDDAFIQRNLSPGGSADLLGVTQFLAQINAMEPVGGAMAS